MSGGSYNYLCHADSLDTLVNKKSDLNDMADALLDRGYTDAAKQTLKIISWIEATEIRVEMQAEQLQGIWRAIEWCESGDTGEDYVTEEINKYRKGLNND